MTHKMAIVVRTDLAMGKGKIAAQAAHAAVSAVLRQLDSPALRAWLEVGQPKVVLRVADDAALDEIRVAAAGRGVPVQAIQDAGHTQVEAGTMTCCAIGPARAEEVDAVCGRLSLL